MAFIKIKDVNLLSFIFVDVSNNISVITSDDEQYFPLALSHLHYHHHHE